MVRASNENETHGGGSPASKLSSCARRYPPLKVSQIYVSRRSGSVATHFATVSGTAGMYSTDESSVPLCSLSTACTKSQCPVEECRFVNNCW